MATSSRSSVPSRRVTRAVTTLAVAATGVAGFAAAPAASAASRTPVAKQAAVKRAAPTTRQTKPLASVTVARFTSTGTNVRASASLTGRRVGTLTAGTRVRGTVTGGWLRLTSPKQYAGRYVKASSLTTTAPRPSQCLPANARVTLTQGFVLCQGYTGVKVRLVRKALGLKTAPVPGKPAANGTLDADAVARVKRLQAAHHLPVTGEIDRATYAAIVRGGNFDVDGWQNASAVAPTASRAERVEAAIAWTNSKAGRPYVWGGTGTGTGGDDDGYDCSGPVLQAVRAGGKNPVNVSNFTDIRPTSDLASQMWKDSAEFAHVTKTFVSTIGGALKVAQRGDLIFYANKSGSVGHIAIYKGRGDNTIINAVNKAIQVNRADSTFGYSRFGVARAFTR